VSAPRRPLVAGNWKMNPPTHAEAVALGEAIADSTVGSATLCVVCPPTIWLEAVFAAAGERLEVGAQTMAAEEGGAFTGETSPLMLAGLARWVIVGHSERRMYCGETDENVGRKVASAVAHALRPIAAIGESRDERRAGATEAVIDRQLSAAIAGLRQIQGSGLVVAYEPIWAIGTGDPASGADAQAAAAQIRAILRKADAASAEEVPILYGGSVTAANAAEFFAEPDVDGALVGGASLDPAGFSRIVQVAAELRG
jgi:triosephosphate isomerase (TIM)